MRLLVHLMIRCDENFGKFGGSWGTKYSHCPEIISCSCNAFCVFACDVNVPVTTSCDDAARVTCHPQRGAVVDVRMRRARRVQAKTVAMTSAWKDMFGFFFSLSHKYSHIIYLDTN